MVSERGLSIVEGTLKRSDMTAGALADANMMYVVEDVSQIDNAGRPGWTD